jgi:hypothetical protein
VAACGGYAKQNWERQSGGLSAFEVFLFCGSTDPAAKERFFLE